MDINPTQLGHNRAVDVPIAGDARAVLEQLRAEAEGKIDAQALRAPWTGKLRTLDAEKGAGAGQGHVRRADAHPSARGSARRSATSCGATRILVVDGQEILNFGRQAIPTYVAGHRLNSGAFGTMGVGLPFGVGAKVAKPDAQVLVLHGDGSYGINAMEIDTAVRHKIPVVVVISNNGGWTADAPWTRPLPKPGRNLGHTRYDRVAQELGAHGEFVEKPQRHPPGAGAGVRLGQARGGQRDHRIPRRGRRPFASPPTPPRRPERCPRPSRESRARPHPVRGRAELHARCWPGWAPT